MYDHDLQAVGPDRTERAVVLPLRTEHEVVDDELTPSVEEIRQRPLSAHTIKDVRFRHFLPRQRAALLVQLVPKPRELLFFFEKCGSGGEPLFMRYDCV